jgi:hypothetical protein
MKIKRKKKFKDKRKNITHQTDEEEEYQKRSTQYSLAKYVTIADS